ncbi:mitochondrial carrier domain-containing protein [Hyaloraphidium curvatum]|nr:mitochondrial carrier domain-containing protein [Hyaloraphidium curvatum]
MVQSNNSVRAGSSEAPRYRNSLHAVRQIASRYGPAALFRGFAVNTAREVAFLSTYFGAYEHAKALISRAADRADPRSDSALLHRIGVPLAGGISGALGWFLSFPLDCVKSQIQGAPPGAERRSAAEIARGLWRAKGIGGFYSGVVPSVARAFLVSSSRFTAYEGTLWLLHRLWGDGWMR